MVTPRKSFKRTARHPGYTGVRTIINASGTGKDRMTAARMMDAVNSVIDTPEANNTFVRVARHRHPQPLKQTFFTPERYSGLLHMAQQKSGAWEYCVIVKTQAGQGQNLNGHFHPGNRIMPCFAASAGVDEEGREMLVQPQLLVMDNAALIERLGRQGTMAVWATSVTNQTDIQNALRAGRPAPLRFAVSRDWQCVDVPKDMWPAEERPRLRPIIGGRPAVHI